MTQTIYGWIAVKENGEPLRNIKTDGFAVFDHKPKTKQRVAPCVIEISI
jgi:hypothetical protein